MRSFSFTVLFFSSWVWDPNLIHRNQCLITDQVDLSFLCYSNYSLWWKNHSTGHKVKRRNRIDGQFDNITSLIEMSVIKKSIFISDLLIFDLIISTTYYVTKFKITHNFHILLLWYSYDWKIHPFISFIT